ncbi:MAG: hypothetical protein HYY06_27865 [Deltaproteobacteria bacterium]|nr:hypothetical protein [Deltaproteobacteria bacterium]
MALIFSVALSGDAVIYCRDVGSPTRTLVGETRYEAVSGAPDVSHYVVNTCGAFGDVEDTVQASKRFGRADLPFRRVWNNVLTVDGETDTSSEGCWSLWDDTECTTLPSI